MFTHALRLQLAREDREGRTLLIIPLILFRSASQLRRWYSGLILSFDASACIALSLAGGMYAPPVLVDSILLNSAFAAASFSCSLAFTFATVPFPLGTGSPLGREGDTDRRRREGGDADRSRGRGDNELRSMSAWSGGNSLHTGLAVFFWRDHRDWHFSTPTCERQVMKTAIRKVSEASQLYRPCLFVPSSFGVVHRLSAVRVAW